jgi:hypothetical protein
MNRRGTERLVILVLCLPAMISILACGSLVSNRTFSVSRWKTASKDERRLMADDFLKKVDTVGMTVDELKRPLGNPDHELDSWSYGLRGKVVLPAGSQNLDAVLQHPQLYVQFRDGKVESLSITDDLDLGDELTFNPTLWKESKASDRLRMTASLMSSETLKGLSKEEVEQLIGGPDGKDENHEIEYDLGYRMMAMVTLTFTLDAAEEVIDAKVIEH